MSEKSAEQIKAYYSELAKVGQSQDWEKILKVTKKILGLSVTEKKAFQCKIVCLIQLDRFDEALTSITNQGDDSGLIFERAYCEYRLNKLQEAYDTVKKSQQSNLKINELLAQICYKLEKYQESYDLYRDIIKNSDDDFDVERQTNLSAVVAALRMANPASTKDLNMAENESKTYELCYNSACIFISKGKYEEAKEKLKKAENMCKKTFDDEEDQETLENEIAIIRVQLAYCLQKLGKSEEALKTYNSSVKFGDASITAVASNNMVCLNKDQNVFDSKKRLKAATGHELELKLNSMQKKTIAFNEILFSIITNQNDLAQKLLKQYEEKFNDKEQHALLRATLFFREKKVADAERFLNEAIKSGLTSPKLKFYLLQAQLAQGKVTDAIELLKTLDELKSHKLGVISALVTLLQSRNDQETITSIFNAAIDHYSQVNINAKELETLIKENSNFQIASGNLKNASEMLERMRAMKPKDYRILSKLIDIYSKFNSQKAKELSKDLPTLEDIVANSNLDIDSLESQFSLLTSKYSRVKTAQLKSPEALKSKQDTGRGGKVEKKKKKKKVKLPKNYDPNKPLDLERWLPLRERSYYKGRRNKKKNTVGKGTQGAVSSKEETAEVTVTSPKAEKFMSQQAERPSIPSNRAKPKGAKKKGKW